MNGDITTFIEEKAEVNMEDYSAEGKRIVMEIINLLENKVRPSVAMDGGDIEFVLYNEETGVLSLKMKGSCSGCPSSTATLKGGIERMMQHYIPEITEVISV